MRLLMFDYEYPPVGGGGGVVHRAIAEELARRHEVAVVTSGHRDLPETEVTGGVTVHRVRVPGRRSLATASLLSMLGYYPASLRKGQSLIDEARPDVINTHFALPTGPSAVRLARRNRIPHVLCVHGGDLYDPSKRLSPHRWRLLRRVVRRVLDGADRVVAQSENTARNAREIYGYDREITLIPHGLRRPEVEPALREALGLRDDWIVLVTVGRLVRRKANDQLIEVLAAIPDPRVVLVLVGDGPERGRLEELAARSGVEDRVVFTGFVAEERKHQLLEASDIFVSTTLHEGFGLMFIEAMFQGLPVVTYDCGGHTDFIEDEKSGFLVPVGDRETFRRRLGELIARADLRERMGLHNRAVSSRFEVERCAERYEEVFEEVRAGASG